MASPIGDSTTENRKTGSRRFYKKNLREREAFRVRLRANGGEDLERERERELLGTVAGGLGYMYRGRFVLHHVDGT